MQNQQYFNQLYTSLVDNGYSITFEAKKELIECTVSKGQVEVRAMSSNTAAALYLAWKKLR